MKNLKMMERMQTMIKKIKYKGVYFISKDPTKLHWKAEIRINGKPRQITGRFETQKEAAIAYDKVAIRYNMPTNILKLRK